MFAYTVRRVISGLLLLVVMSAVTFVLFFASTPTPERFACGPKCTPAQLEVTRQALGYDRAVPVQWAEFAKGVVAGRTFPADPDLRAAAPDQVRECPAPCLGYSRVYSENVLDVMKDKLPISISLALAAFVMWIVIGVGLGIVTALFKGTWIDRGIVGLTLIAFAFPTFFLGKFALTFVAIQWELLPYPQYTSIADGGVLNWLGGLFLPAFVLALVFIAGYVRITRAFVLETMSEDYIRTAKSKGLSQRVVIGKHTLRAVLTPLVTLAGLDLAGLLGGAIIAESVFNYNGLGKLAVTAIQRQDLPVIVGIVLMVATFVVVANIVVDLLYAVIDPRVRLS